MAGLTSRVLGLAFTALATTSVLPRALAEEPPGFSLRDTRPGDDKKTQNHSLIITSCNYGVRTIGDADMSPPPLEQMRASLAGSLGAALEGKELEVRRYHVEVNNAASLRGHMERAFAGLVTDVMAGMGAKCSRDKMEAGWFDASEVTTDNSPIIVEMQVVVDGKTLDVRNVYSPTIKWEPRLWKPESRESVNAALAAGNAKLAEALRGALGRAEQAPGATVPPPDGRPE